MSGEQVGQRPEQWERIKGVFEAALEREPQQRAAFLEATCSGDAELRREVESLLAAHQASDSFLEHPAAAVAQPRSPAGGQLSEGQTVGTYRVLRTLGRGGMATVYLAHDLRHRRSVALKVLHPELGHAVGADRFLREIEVAANLSHPHILPLFDSGEIDALLYYVMPYVEGESLRDRLRRETQLPVEEALQIGREVADALGYAHGQGVIHRDIKPENILLSGGHALVADFGIAHVLGPAGSERLTETGMAVGTVAYMSPEQASGTQRIDGRSDVYSLGCVVYEMLAGEPPYTGPSAQAIITKRLSDPVPSVRRLRTSVPPSLDQAVTKALGPVPADRFATVVEFARSLDQTVAAALTPPMVPKHAFGETLAASRAAAVPRPRGRRLLPAVLVAVGLGLSVLLLQPWRPRAGAKGESSPAVASGHQLVAVLPFQTIGSDTSQRYFTAGMTEEITAQISRVAALRVVSSRVTRGYQGATDHLSRMARDLGVGSVVTGSVRLAGQQVRIAVQLADTRSGQTLWSEQYDRSLADIFEVQGDVARRIAGALQATLTPAEAQRLERPLKVDPAAHDFYLRSLEMSHIHEGRMEAGIALLRRALAIDSTFVDARVELGRRFFFLSIYGSPAYADSALEIVRRALATQPDHPAAWATLGDIQSWTGRLTEARRSYGTALALNPSNVHALQDLSFTEIVRGRPDEGLRWALRSAPLTGDDPNMYYHSGAALLRLERDEVTEAWLEAGKRRQPPNFSRLENLLSVLDLLRGNDRRAMERVRRVMAREPGNEEVRAALADFATVLAAADAEELTAAAAKGNPHARSGWLMPESFGALHALTLHRRGERARADSLWDAALAADRRDIANGHENPDRWVQTAAIQAVRGDTAAALDWLDRGYRAGWNDARILTRDPFFQRLHQVPRFRELLRRMTVDIAKMREGARATSDSLLALSRRPMS